MSNSPAILETARARAAQMGLPYSGALLPQEAFELWQTLPGTQLVDVRTRAEWDWVGRIPASVEIEWLSYPDNRPNSGFVQQLQQRVDAILFVRNSLYSSSNSQYKLRYINQHHLCQS